MVHRGGMGTRTWVRPVSSACLRGFTDRRQGCTICYGLADWVFACCARLQIGDEG